MTPNHHPLPETLISYASGALPNAMFAVVACHLAMCRVCARDVHRLELLGGLMMSRLDPRPVDISIGQRTFSRSHAVYSSNATENAARTRSDDQLLPQLLTRNFPISPDISWQSVSPGVQQHRIALPKSSGQMRLLRLTPGKLLPHPTQRADAELALVLQGVLSNKNGDLVRGDVIEWTEECYQEARAAGDVDCVCLIAVNPSGIATTNIRTAYRDLRRSVSPVALRLGSALRGSVPFAAGLTLLMGFGLGLLVHRAPEAGTIANFVKVDGNRLIAQGPLQEALQALPSGNEAIASLDGREVRLGIKMTFEEQSGAYCRQYRIVASPAGHYSGIACFMGADWVVRMHALLPPSVSRAERTVPADAGASAAMDAVIGAWISGNPLVGRAEAEVMSKGWKK